MVSEAASSFLVVQDPGATGWCCRLAQSEHAICKRMFEGSGLMGGRLIVKRIWGVNKQQYSVLRAPSKSQSSLPQCI